MTSLPLEISALLILFHAETLVPYPSLHCPVPSAWCERWFDWWTSFRVYWIPQLRYILFLSSFIPVSAIQQRITTSSMNDWFLFDSGVCGKEDLASANPMKISLVQNDATNENWVVTCVSIVFFANWIVLARTLFCDGVMFRQTVTISSAPAQIHIKIWSNTIHSVESLPSEISRTLKNLQRANDL